MWTDEKVLTLKRLWLQGLSASQVARQIGVTRNAVIGKVHRLGLSGRARPPALRRPAQARPKPHGGSRPRGSARPATAPPQPAEAFLETPESPGLAASLTQLGPRCCRWPIGDPRAPDFSFCGHPSEAEGPYCARHHQLGVQPRQPKPLASDRSLLRLLRAA